MKLFFTIVFCALGMYSTAQTGKHYTKIVIEQELTQDQSLAIQNHIKQLDGVTTGRMDPTTHTLLAIYTQSTTTNDQEMIEWLDSNGYTVTCYFSDVYEEGKMIELSSKHCH